MRILRRYEHRQPKYPAMIIDSGLIAERRDASKSKLLDSGIYLRLVTKRMDVFLSETEGQGLQDGIAFREVNDEREHRVWEIQSVNCRRLVENFPSEMENSASLDERMSNFDDVEGSYVYIWFAGSYLYSGNIRPTRTHFWVEDPSRGRSFTASIKDSISSMNASILYALLLLGIRRNNVSLRRHSQFIPSKNALTPAAYNTNPLMSSPTQRIRLLASGLLSMAGQFLLYTDRRFG
ncbi:hypothetical protein ARMSODRAFT_978638 [Armillaria solidipes]|uniref:Uncharacterized protein n=1 Tax=Armillaria solidipes TaxID=1076256 RepID=A0A2H3B257_9AGAR|nr:hypothetical protein ARMSODRAFT_978638 [Armillaria solidipes]